MNNLSAHFAQQWWKETGARFHHLMMLAKKYLAIPGSSVPSECLFSKAGELISEKRGQLKPKNVDILQLLYAFCETTFTQYLC